MSGYSLTFGVKSLRRMFLAAGTNAVGRVRYSAGLISQKRRFKSCTAHEAPVDRSQEVTRAQNYPSRDSLRTIRAATTGHNIKGGDTVDGITHLEVSPGTITITPCQWCGNDAITFDTLALGNEGVAWAGTIRRCPTCEKRQP